VISAVDLGDGVDGLPPTPGLRYRTAAGARVIVRPSGTEPKLKIYTEVVVQVGDREVREARAEAQELLAALGRDVTSSLGLASAGR
jgi:phosphomannomutase